MYGLKVVTPDEMKRIEQEAISKGADETEFMENAGKVIASCVETYLYDKKIEPLVTLLVGKGNNAGDALVAGLYLLNRGIPVRAVAAYPKESCSPLCQKQLERFQDAGGEVQYELEFPGYGIVLDGLVGTGFKGKAESVLAAAIVAANRSGLPIIACDIPSGLDGTTGESHGVAIRATATITLGLPKWGFFIQDGWNHIGELIVEPFGLEDEFIAKAHAKAYLVDGQKMASLLPPIVRNRHKYQAGYLLAIGGSRQMPGAAQLASIAALRSGAGIVRLFHGAAMESSFFAPEVIREEMNPERVIEEEKRAHAFVVGPGLGRSAEVTAFLRTLLPRLTLPTVLDADALYFLSEQPETALPKKTLLTPHHEEMARLLGKKEKGFAVETFQNYAEKKNVTLILKGAPTFIFHPHEAPLIMLRGSPGMATAGTGDVLTGILGSLLAQGMEPHPAAVLGSWLHGIAGEEAATLKTPYGMIASDLISFLPDALKYS